MCGIFGAVGTRINSGSIRALALINRERGTDSLGFFSNTGKMLKRADDPMDCLACEDFAVYIEKVCRDGWFIAGHTRHATHGTVINRNAHPFRYGRIIGSHNGIVTAPKKYTVDSQFLIDSINRAGGDYQAALADVYGYWGLSWFDGRDFYLQAHHNTIAYGCDRTGTFYYSSDVMHLESSVRITRNSGILGDGDTIRFNCKTRKPETMPRFVSNIVVKPIKSKWTGTVSKWDKRGNYIYDEIVDDSTKFSGVDSAKHDERMKDPFYVGDARDDYMEAWERYTEEYK